MQATPRSYLAAMDFPPQLKFGRDLRARLGTWHAVTASNPGVPSGFYLATLATFSSKLQDKLWTESLGSRLMQWQPGQDVWWNLKVFCLNINWQQCYDYSRLSRLERGSNGMYHSHQHSYRQVYGFRHLVHKHYLGMKLTVTAYIHVHIRIKCIRTKTLNTNKYM